MDNEDCYHNFSTKVEKPRETVQKENQETDKSVTPKKQDNVQWLYPRKEEEFDKPGTSNWTIRIICMEESSCKIFFLLANTLM
uniref:Uncharacterized protein n=1 Tax=Romanomermis culicivorax TaxID=13658 RepID=A0A915HLP1_ROMCU